MKKSKAKKVIKKNALKRDMSVSELAGMVARGFTEMRTDMGEHFDGIEGRLDGVEGRLESVEGRLNILDHKVDRLQDSVNEISYESRKKTTRIENLELKVFGSIQEA